MDVIFFLLFASFVLKFFWCSLVQGKFHNQKTCEESKLSNSQHFVSFRESMSQAGNYEIDFIVNWSATWQ
jgi:hypothetical protein